MCGILGQINRESSIDTELFARMLATLDHRGPDARGIRMLDNATVAIGHTRLSIIDLSDAASQPMCNEDGSVWLTFNGEIYNYRELRHELQRLGHAFKSQSDSEVIIHAYEAWGTASVARLRGIFAFAIYDSAARMLLLARDHIGVKPLYYHAGPKSFMFASQPRAILESDLVERSLDPVAFSLYLAYGNVPGEHCIYAGVQKLLPGHWLTLKDGRLETRRYWAASYTPVIRDAAEAEEAVRWKIEECIAAQSVSDVPIGTLLSGGVDSTIVTAVLASQSSRERPATFTVGFDDPESDERSFAQAVADACGTRHRVERLSYDAAMASLPHIIDAFDEPFDLNGLFPYSAVSRLVHDEGYKVALGGDGADELFAGYLWYETCDKQGLLTDKPRWFHLWSAGHARSSRSVEAFFGINGYLGRREQQDLAGSRFNPLTRSEMIWPLERHWHPNLPPVLAAQFMDFHCFLPDHCLTKVDRAGMSHGVEVRVPFLDVGLVELVFSIDHDITFKDGTRKALLHRAMRHRLRTNTSPGRKKGFSSPVNQWLQRGLASRGHDLVRNGSLCSHGYLDPEVLHKGFSQLSSRCQLMLISAELWFRRWIENDTGITQQLTAESGYRRINTARVRA